MFKIVLISIAITFLMIFIFGCSGKTTVKEEMIDTTPREKTEDSKQATDKKSSESDKSANEESDDESNKESDEKPSKKDGNTSDGDRDPVNPISPIGPGDDRTEQGGGKAAREKYYQDNLAYPGAEPVENPIPSDSPGYTGKTLTSKDSASTVSAWYMSKLSEKATMNKMGAGSGEQYRINVKDPDNGYVADIIISQVDRNNPTRIMISLRET